jgi:hypothetical protein
MLILPLKFLPMEASMDLIGIVVIIIMEEGLLVILGQLNKLGFHLDLGTMQGEQVIGVQRLVMVNWVVGMRVCIVRKRM